MKVLVTGTRGFVGAAIERRLIADGHEVLGAVRRRDLGAREVFLDLGTDAPIRDLPGDKYQYLVTSAHFGAHFPNDKLRAAFPELRFADWRDGVREAVAALRPGLAPGA